MDAGEGDDYVLGGGGNDTLYGGGGNDKLTGDDIGLTPAYEGADYIDGGAGDDAIPRSRGRRYHSWRQRCRFYRCR
nr:hypothetical protein DBV21_13050 [Pseudomonas congelans]